MMQALLPSLIESRGTVVNISSVGGKVAMATYGPYAASKYALEAVSYRAAGRDTRLRRSDRVAPGRAAGRCARTLLWPRQTVFDPWHYVPVLARKPGALRNGAPFKDWVLPPGIKTQTDRIGL